MSACRQCEINGGLCDFHSRAELFDARKRIAELEASLAEWAPLADVRLKLRAAEKRLSELEAENERLKELTERQRDWINRAVTSCAKNRCATRDQRIREAEQNAENAERERNEAQEIAEKLRFDLFTYMDQGEHPYAPFPWEKP